MWNCTIKFIFTLRLSRDTWRGMSQPQHLTKVCVIWGNKKTTWLLWGTADQASFHFLTLPSEDWSVEPPTTNSRQLEISGWDFYSGKADILEPQDKYRHTTVNDSDSESDFFCVCVCGTITVECRRETSLFFVLRHLQWAYIQMFKFLDHKSLQCKY